MYSTHIIIDLFATNFLKGSRIIENISNFKYSTDPARDLGSGALNVRLNCRYPTHFSISLVSRYAVTGYIEPLVRGLRRPRVRGWADSPVSRQSPVG